MTIKGDRSKSRSVMFRPFCTWLTSLVMRVTSVGVPIRSSSVWLRVLMWANRSPPQCRAKTQSGLGGKVLGGQAAGHAHNGQKHQQAALPPDKGQVGVLDAFIHDTGHHKGHQQLKTGLQHLEQRGDDSLSFSYPLR